MGATGSGNFGHAGRPGEVGGSGPGGVTVRSKQMWDKHARAIAEQDAKMPNAVRAVMSPSSVKVRVLKKKFLSKVRMPNVVTNQKPETESASFIKRFNSVEGPKYRSAKR